MKRTWLLPATLALAIVGVLVGPKPSVAASKGEIGFQARLVQDGVPIEGTLDLTFEIYDHATASAPANLLYSEEQTGVPVSNGLVSVTLGGADPARFAEIWGDGHLPSSDRWITIKLGDKTSTDYLLSQRVRVSSVPYSLSSSAASVASSIWDGSTSTGLDLGDLDSRYVRADVTGPSHTISGSSAASGILYLEGTSDGGTQGTVIVKDPLEVQGNLTIGGVAYLEEQSGSPATLAGHVALWTRSDGSLFVRTGAGHELAVGVTPSHSDGRLSVSATDSTASTQDGWYGVDTLYFVRHKGSRVSLYSGNSWKSFEISDTSPPSLSASTVAGWITYDVFLHENAGVLALEVVPWSSYTVRSVPLMFQDGVRVKNLAPTHRYLGTIRPIIDVNSDVRFADSNKFRHVWNVQNQVTRHMGEYWLSATTITGASGVLTEPHTVTRRFFVLGLPSAIRATGSYYFGSSYRSRRSIAGQLAAAESRRRGGEGGGRQRCGELRAPLP